MSNIKKMKPSKRKTRRAKLSRRNKILRSKRKISRSKRKISRSKRKISRSKRKISRSKRKISRSRMKGGMEAAPLPFHFTRAVDDLMASGMTREEALIKMDRESDERLEAAQERMKVVEEREAAQDLLEISLAQAGSGVVGSTTPKPSAERRALLAGPSGGGPI